MNRDCLCYDERLCLRDQNEQKAVAVLRPHILMVYGHFWQDHFLGKFTKWDFYLMHSSTWRGTAIIHPRASNDDTVSIGEEQKLDVFTPDTGDFRFDDEVAFILDDVDPRLPTLSARHDRPGPEQFTLKPLEISVGPKPFVNSAAGHAVSLPSKPPFQVQNALRMSSRVTARPGLRFPSLLHFWNKKRLLRFAVRRLLHWGKRG